MRKTLFVLGIAFIVQNAFSQTIKYSTTWFGPNANPVPEFTDATIPSKTTFSLTSDYYKGHGYYGYGDQTVNGYIKVEIPMIPKRVSLKIWSTVLEHYKTTPEIMKLRGSTKLSGYEAGDIYVQTRIKILNEKKFIPAIVLNSTLKTASANTDKTRRYFDTPGYYFDVEGGKSFFTGNSFLHEIRLVADYGFMCWETTNSRQDDAPMYGGKIILKNDFWKFENSLSGYSGWMHTNANYGSDYGDAPQIYTSKFSIISKNISYFAQFEHGIRDFPYNQFRLGVKFSIAQLTPKFN